MITRTALALVALAAFSLPCRGADANALLGAWHGSSLCTDLKVAPGCHDEQVVYDVSIVAGAVDKVHISADKLVAGKRELMGQFDLVQDGADGGAWVYDFSTRAGLMRWRFLVHGARLDGELLAMPARTRIRQVQATPGAR